MLMENKMKKEWILQQNETRRKFSNSTWVPLRASYTEENGNIKNVGFVSEYFGCGSAAFPPEHKEKANNFGWSEIGIGRDVQPYAFEDGGYASIEQYQITDNEPIGVNLVFEHPQYVVGGKLWILNPDLVVALHLIKDGSNWVRPEENFEIVAREVVDEKGHYRKIEIKREFLIDYLAARNLSLRLSYYRQRVENVESLEGSDYATLANTKEMRDDGEFNLLICSLDEVYGGSWSSIRVWRTDVDEDEDAPVLGPECDENTDYEHKNGHVSGFIGMRVEGEFWRNEWIEHQGQSIRVRGDEDNSLPHFIVETDGKRMASVDLRSEDIGRWLWFRSSVVRELLGFRGFSLKWYSAETGAIGSTSGRDTHFGINDSDLVTVYACDIARLDAWEQRIWAAHNLAPDGKVSKELLSSQVTAKPASTYAVELLLLNSLQMLENTFYKEYKIQLFTHEIDKTALINCISRFESFDLASLLRLAKELVRVFSDRLNVSELRKISKNSNKQKLGSNKLFQDVLAQKIGEEEARKIFSSIIGIYDMRVGDAHPTGSKIGEALQLAGIDDSLSFIRQGEQLIGNYERSIRSICESIVGQ